MDPNIIASLVRNTLAGYRHELPQPGSTVGVAWSAHQVRRHVEKLEAALVKPYLQRFELRETYEQVRQLQPTYAEFWVVAEAEDGCLEWYDPATGDFGLGVRKEDYALPLSIGARGDLVGVFCAR